MSEKKPLPEYVREHTIDPVTLDIIENALQNARYEMDRTLVTTALSPVIREQEDQFPLIADRGGRMLVGQFGNATNVILENSPYKASELKDGDVIALNDPYMCEGSVSHLNDFMIVRPIFYEDDLVGYACQWGHLMDVGGKTEGSQPMNVRSIFEEGIRMPPVKLYSEGVLNEELLRLFTHNSRLPDQIEGDIKAIMAGTRAGAERVKELCERFGKDTYLEACDAILDRTRSGVLSIIREHIPDGEKFEFIDYTDDDGMGNGPIKLKLTMQRDGDTLNFDWTGTDPQVPGPVNFYENPTMFRMFVGVFLIVSFDPSLVFNDGYYDVINVEIPEGTVMQPKFPAPVSNRLNNMVRQLDVIQAVISQAFEDSQVGGTQGTGANLIYAGAYADGTPFQTMEVLYGGVPARPVGDGLDGHSIWPEFRAVPIEYLESYYPLSIDAYEVNIDSGGPGEYRGGNGIKRIYTFLENGHITYQDDRAHFYPYGVDGGRHGGPSIKTLIRARDGEEITLPSKAEGVPVYKGDKLIFISAGSGGIGDPLKRDPDRVVKDVRRGLVSKAAALESYGVVLNDDLQLDEAATVKQREKIAAERPEEEANAQYDLGPLPSIEEIRTEISETRKKFNEWLASQYEQQA